MFAGLRSILRDVAGDSVGSDSYTHVSLYGPHAKWSIRTQNQTEFWSKYCDLVDLKTNGRDGIPPDPFADICLAERPQEIMPVMSKLTLKFQIDDEDLNWEPYGDDFLHGLCNVYQNVLLENFAVDTETYLELIVLVLESVTHWYEEDRDNGTKNMNMEIKLQFPFARVDAGLQGRLIRTNVIKSLRNNNLMSKLQKQPIGDWDQIISVNMVNLPVTMYGSTEVTGRPKLELKHIWQYIDNEMLNNEEIPDDNDLEGSFEPHNHQQVLNNSIDTNIFEENPNLNYWLPMFLSIEYWRLVLKPKQIDNGRFTNTVKTLNAKVETSSNRVFGAVGNNSDMDENDFELGERMMGLLSNERFRKESSWLDIGKAFYNADNGGENGLAAWVKHSEKALNSNPPDYAIIAGNIADTCNNLYYTFSNCSITIKTLAWYAREDSPDKYANWHKDWCMASMEKALSCYHTDVAIALHRVFWLDFVYSSLGKGKWFQFRNHRWSEINQGIALRQEISGSFMKKFERARMVLTRQIHESTDENFKGNAEITVKKITTLIGKLKTVSFKSSIMAESCEQFNFDKFVNLLDTNSELTGVTNGILEICNGYVIFRNAKPEDYISMCSGNPYHTLYTWEHPLVLECMKWINQVFTDKSMAHHFLKFAASCLRGKNSDKIFPIWTGDGDNSKSMIVKLFEATLNSYCIKFPVALLSEKAMNSSGPTPQLARAKSTRLAFLDEPEDDVPMHKGTIKRYTGGDSFFARQLHSDGNDVQATFKMVLMCNKVPLIPNADKAMKNRAKLFPFTSTWVNDPPASEAEQMKQRKFKKNPSFERRIPILAPAFLWIMSKYYPYYHTEGLVDPQAVIEHTENYWRDNDVYAQFVADMIQNVYTPSGKLDEGARVTLSEIYAEFKVWFKDAFPGTKVPERSIVKTELSNRWGRMVNNAWAGIRIITSDSPMDLSSSLAGKKTNNSQPIILGEVVKNLNVENINKGPIINF